LDGDIFDINHGVDGCSELVSRHSPSGMPSDVRIAWIFLLDKCFCPDRRLWSCKRLELGEPGREVAASLPGSFVLQRSGQTCPAALVQEISKIDSSGGSKEFCFQYP
jgi:hypothetical protein